MSPQPMTLSLCEMQQKLHSFFCRCALSAGLLALTAMSLTAAAQAPAAAQSEPDRISVLEHRIDQMQADLNEVRALLAAERAHAAGAPVAPAAPAVLAASTAAPASAPAAPTSAGPASTSSSVASAAAPATATPVVQTAASSVPASSLLMLPNGSTINLLIDTYIGYNANQSVGRVNYLHAYDVLDDVYGINQADVMYELLPDLAAGRRYGLRLDLQYGQATATLQGSPANEGRPDLWRNLFQAYGRYVIPAGKGVTVDVGKWASSLGYEGNYSKDQMQYSRAFFFNFLPFYHAGLRANYAFNDKLSVNYWMVNGTNQTEPTNSFKDELFGFSYSPTRKISWTSNYYLGQENPDSVASTSCTLPVQPGLCYTPINPAPNGRTHIIDNYVAFQATPKLLLVGEGDYFISRKWRNAGPGESAAPSHVDGGAAYAQYQFDPRASLAIRGEYLSDRNGLFSNASQALKEATIAYKYNFADGFVGFLEYRRDWSNTKYFLQGPNNTPSNHQDVVTLGMVWSYGGKQGAW
ncbi:Putative beta-barrel porin-2, OmpL-like. bbp2 [Bryocella elongata]|uniref:Putative beta-barrel porin-2, OmpL-like. bbp2 n=1 Tax=Bryocella elongata TaxID=863522 RepID=A0A1H5WPZ6_9BACT|nr:outer membrane beta-barrel protein [Bryocella elongata]SEG01609.1 Putative beta-barrel porin-2, OmpL-like. bbp2 [Bryocella elongata]